ncbi:MAG: glutathione-disulfide reductase [Gammaproteobacteria bacterium]|jgi:glutathione reductase (NADPH)|nr:glutathione-disulfide reductase [Gammaproteobacteria bacterium]MBT4493941.1 glutathione-disulfide reductase [Gammaproteobacteria bacterium]MBT7369049.1 glutathione-disulfide reductase [Gammaproteobacteria bacterium]
MASYDYDLFVIGVGSGGVRAARMSAQYGARVATAEEKYMGGTCVNVGCVPKKLFVYASHYSEDYQQAEGFGWDKAAPGFNWPTLLNNKNTEISRLNGVYKGLLDTAGVTHFDGRARIVDKHHIAIGDTTVSTERILIATGSWPVVPEFSGNEHVITSNEAFFLEQLPRRCLVVGGGYIAVEFAGIFHGLGVDTKLSYRGPLFLRHFDIDIRETVREELQKKNIDLMFETNVSAIEKKEDGTLRVIFKEGNELETDLVLYATGRESAVKDIGLENVNVETRENGSIIVDEEFRTSEENIFALGDVIGHMQLTPVAIEEAMCFANTQFLGERKVIDYSNIATAVFCQPNVGTVGLTENEARESCEEIDIYRSSFRPMKHTLSGSDERFMMKLIVDRKTDKVLGVHMVGSDAGEIIQGISIAMKMGVTKTLFDSTIGIHPTTAEEFVTMREPVPVEK